MTLSTASSQTLSPLPSVLSHGLVAVSTFGLLSFFCSTSLFFYLTYKIISWRLQSRGKEPMNQFLFLIYNLLLADIQQALAFLLNISALRNDAILVGTTTCFAQGWFVSTGDLASSTFICAIAIHTFLGVVKNYRLPAPAFYSAVAAMWVFVYGLGIAGPLMHGREFYVRASAWCWINAAYASERLWLHYFWIFVFMLSTVLIYAAIFLTLKTRSSRQSLSEPILHGATPLMILYPLIYVICTSPLAVGRIVALSGVEVSLEYFCAAGTMIACNGWLDVLLYASTRAEILFSEYPPGEDTGLDTFAFMGKGHKMGTTTTIEAGVHGQRLNSGESVERLYGLDQLDQRGVVTVRKEVIQGSQRVQSVHESWDATSIKSRKNSQS